jgi:hypothetical protein
MRLLDKFRCAVGRTGMLGAVTEPAVARSVDRVEVIERSTRGMENRVLYNRAKDGSKSRGLRSTL